MREDERRALLLHALRAPRGRYVADRASQLSGVPRSTIYDWARERVLIPDFKNASPTLWSYRDLVFLRLLARMRQNGIDRPSAADAVKKLRTMLAKPNSDVTTVKIAGGLFLGSDRTDIISGQQAFEEALKLTQSFDLLEPIEGVTIRPTWGPDLVEPSDHTYISPHVMGGDPCVDESRVPSATIFALVEDRGLRATNIIKLYPQLSEDGVEDAFTLERRMRRAA